MFDDTRGYMHVTLGPLRQKPQLPTTPKAGVTHEKSPDSKFGCQMLIFVNQQLWRCFRMFAKLDKDVHQQNWKWLPTKNMWI